MLTPTLTPTPNERRRPMTNALRLSPFDAAAILIVLAAALGYLNFRFLKLPSSIGLTIMGAVASLIVVALDRVLPGSGLAHDVAGFIAGIDFHTTLMEGMLSFLLFAGALHVDWHEMRRGRWPILVLSTIGVVLSTVLVGGGFLLLARVIGFDVPAIWCFVFGALISPTDPVSVMGVLKRAKVSPTLEATVAGESLFNDGVGVVIFSILLASAVSGADFSILEGVRLFAVEAGGGILLGLAIGGIAFRAMRSIDDYKVEVLISLAVVMGGYAVAHPLHASGPVAMAVAGLIIGNAGVAHAMSETTRDYLHKFWDLVDDILNTVLFLLIGLEVVTIPADLRLLILGIAAIPLALAARALSVILPLRAIRPTRAHDVVVPATLIWGGLRGGISVALALGLPEGPARALILAATYVVVLFSVIIQGGTIERLLDRLSARGTAS
jgi:CPA1 family monovalent cation:H+ antiporter